MISRELMMMSVCFFPLCVVVVGVLSRFLAFSRVFFFLLGDTFCFVFFFFFSKKNTARARDDGLRKTRQKRERERDFVFVFVFVFVFFESPRFRQSSLATKKKKEKSSPLFCEKKTTTHALQRVLCFSSTSRAEEIFETKKRFSPPFRERTEKR